MNKHDDSRESDLIGCYVDPPQGYLYGFPAIYTGENGQTLRDFIASKGYPMEDYDKWAKNHIWIWRNVD